MPGDGSYNVIDTDYNSYALVYSCSEGLIKATEYAWILSRAPTLPERKISELLDLLEEQVGYSRENLVFTDQTPCNWQ